MEEFQFSGDTPSLYYAQAAWEFQHNNPEKANDWITSARKIYPLASNDLYAARFYDLGWLKSAAAISSPAPSAAAIASTQTESSGPAIEPSPIPGSEVKAEEGTQLAMAQTTPAPSPAETTTGSATPATASAPEKVAQFTPSPSFGERISSFTGQRPLVFWLFILGAIASGGAWLVMEARRLISRTSIGHRPATVTGPS